MEEIEVREAKPEEQARVLAIQTLAFSRDPVMRWLYPEARDYLTNFPMLADAFGGGAFACDAAHVAEDFGGSALWLKPGEHVDGERLGAHFEASIDKPQLDTVFAVLEDMDRYHIDEPHWYLPMIGVDPARQGRGIGGALLQYALAKCDADSLPAFLESSNPANIPLYERHGFEAVGLIQQGDAPPITPMLRTAR